MLVLGLVGGIASGKSLVANALARLGAEVISADQLGHLVLLEPEVISQLRDHWGEGVMSLDCQLDRKAIAKRVFGPTETALRERKFLEQVTHPRIAARMRDRISQLAAEGAVDVVVLDAALLLEAGWQQYCDRLWFIDAPRETRLARAEGRGWSKDEYNERESAQLPLSQKRAVADTVIDNSGATAETLAQVNAAWQSLTTTV